MTMGVSTTTRIKRFLANGGLVLLLIAGIVFATYLIQPRILAYQNVINVLRNTAILSIISMGQMLVMIVGGFDLSVGVLVAFASIETAIVMGWMLQIMPDLAPLAIVLSVLIALGTCGMIGMVNGMLVAVLSLSPFLVTLAMSSVVAGVTFYITKGIPIYGMPESFTIGFGRGFILGVPTVIVIGLATVLIIFAIQRFTAFGRHVYAVGSNPVASRQSGIGVTRTLMLIYGISGVTAALTGVILTARIGSGQSTIGTSFVLESIAAAVLGGVSLMGGSGRAERVVAGALFLSIVSNAMNLLRIDSKFQTLVLGVVLIAAVSAELLLKGRRERG